MQFFLLLPLLLISPPDSSFALKVTPISKTTFVHNSYKMFGKDIYEANGLIVEGEQGVVVIDTPWDTSQSEQLISWVSTILHKNILCCIVTHAHEDRIGGIVSFLRHGIRVLSTPLTARRAAALGYLPPAPVLPDDTLLTWGDLSLECYYPGRGHTDDNIVVWLPKEKILFGGCIVKSTNAQSLGNIADADLDAWPVSIRNLIKKFPDRRIVVPGHEAWSDIHSLEHTLDLLERAR